MQFYVTDCRGVQSSHGAGSPEAAGLLMRGRINAGARVPIAWLV